MALDGCNEACSTAAQIWRKHMRQPALAGRLLQADGNPAAGALCADHSGVPAAAGRPHGQLCALVLR